MIVIKGLNQKQLGIMSKELSDALSDSDPVFFLALLPNKGVKEFKSRSLWARTDRTDGPEPRSHQTGMSNHKSDGDHADSSAASTSSGKINCEIVDRN